jgi:tetratricopeptide (TPR) repeat protein
VSHDAAARAEALLAVGRANEAIEILSRELATEPDDVWLLEVLVRAQLQIDHEDALKTAETLVRLEPDYAYGYRFCAIAHDQVGRRDEAIQYARTASTLAPDDPYVLSTHAVIAGRRKKGHWEGMNAAKRAVEVAPGMAVGYFAGGMVELSEGHWRRSAKWFERALEIDPHDRAAQVNLAIAREAAGDVVAALGGVDGVLRFDPTDEHARETLDGMVYSTIVHLLWVVLALLFVVVAVRGAL